MPRYMISSVEPDAKDHVRKVSVNARNRHAAKRKGRIQLGLTSSEPVKVNLKPNVNFRIGQVPPIEQINILSLFSRLLTSKVSIDTAYERLGENVVKRHTNETAAEGLERSGLHPVACAILSGGESAGHAGEGAEKASDWLINREKRKEEFIGPAQRQMLLSLFLIALMFAFPILTHAMFDQLPSNYVKIQHTPVSKFMYGVYETVYAPFGNAFVALFLFLGVIAGTLFAIAKTANPIRDRLIFMGAMRKLSQKEALVAWISMYIPFHQANLPFAHFVRSGARAFRKGDKKMSQSFNVLLDSVRKGESDSLATAAVMYPDAIPGGMSDTISVMADMDQEAGQKHLRSIMNLCTREMRNLASKVSSQGKRIKMIVIIVMLVLMITGIYAPMYSSMSAPQTSF